MSATHVARLDHVSKVYGNTVALRELTFEVEEGSVVALLGPNGAGKTTAVKLLLGLTAPTSGSASLFGGDPRKPSTRRRAGAMLQVGKVPETLRVDEHIELFRSYYPRPLSFNQAIQLGGLEGIEKRKFGELSGGQKQRLLFALALCGDPDVLFLDEPTLGFDVEVRRAFWKQIRGLVSRGKTVLLTTHYLEEADALADRIIVIDHGSIVADGTPAQIKGKTSSHRIRCSTTLDLATVRTIPGVTTVDIENGRAEILVTIAEPVVRELLRLDESLSNLEVSGAALDDAFIALTTREEAA